MENIAPNRGPRERLRKEAAPRDIPPRTVEAARNADHYTQLGVTRDAAPAEIRRAYHRLVFAHHPDKVDRVAVQSLSSSSFSVSSSSSSSSSSTTTAAAATTTTTPTHEGTLRKTGGDDGLDGLSFPCNIDIDTDEDDVDVDATAITEDKDLERDSSNNHATANAVPRSPTSPSKESSKESP